MYEEHKGKRIGYDEYSNTWSVEGYDEEELPSLKAAREYIDKALKSEFSRFRALAEGVTGTVTSITANGRRAWFTPDNTEGHYRGGRRMVYLEDVFPLDINKAAIANWQALSATIKDLEKKQAALDEQRNKVLISMKSYAALHPELTD